MPVNCGGAGIHPQAGRMPQLRNSPAQQQRALHSGFLNRSPVLRRIPAIDAPAGKVDQHIGMLQFTCPIAQAEPSHRTTRQGAA